MCVCVCKELAGLALTRVVVTASGSVQQTLGTELCGIENQTQENFL